MASESLLARTHSIPFKGGSFMTYTESLFLECLPLQAHNPRVNASSISSRMLTPHLNTTDCNLLLIHHRKRKNPHKIGMMEIPIVIIYAKIRRSRPINPLFWDQWLVKGLKAPWAHSSTRKLVNAEWQTGSNCWGTEEEANKNRQGSQSTQPRGSTRGLLVSEKENTIGRNDGRRLLSLMIKIPTDFRGSEKFHIEQQIHSRQWDQPKG